MLLASYFFRRIRQKASKSHLNFRTTIFISKYVKCGRHLKLIFAKLVRPFCFYFQLCSIPTLYSSVHCYSVLSLFDSCAWFVPNSDNLFFGVWLSYFASLCCSKTSTAIFAIWLLRIMKSSFGIFMAVFYLSWRFLFLTLLNFFLLCVCPQYSV